MPRAAAFVVARSVGWFVRRRLARIRPAAGANKSDERGGRGAGRAVRAPRPALGGIRQLAQERRGVV